MLGKAIQNSQKVAQVALGGGLLSAGIRQQRSQLEAFQQEGLLGVLNDRLHPLQVPQNQEQNAFQKRERREPIRDEREQEEELKEEIKNDEEAPLIEQSNQGDNIITQLPDLPPMPQTQEREVQEQDVELLLQERGINEEERKDSEFLKLAKVFLVGQVLTNDNLYALIDKIRDAWIYKREKTWANDPQIEQMSIQERIQRPTPINCKRVIYRDSQTGVLRSVVICSDGQRIYNDI